MATTKYSDITLADIGDRWARQLGQIDIARILGAALSHSNPLIARLTDGSTFINPAAVSNDWTRQLGQIDIARVLGAALSHGNPLIARISDGSTFINAAKEDTLTKIVPTAKTAIFNTLKSADSNMLTSPIIPTLSPSYLRIYACMNPGGILRVRRIQNGTSVSENLNSGSQLVAGAAYMFTVPWRSGDQINFWYSQPSTVLAMVVDEIGAAE